MRRMTSAASGRGRKTERRLGTGPKTVPWTRVCIGRSRRLSLVLLCGLGLGLVGPAAAAAAPVTSVPEPGTAGKIFAGQEVGACQFASTVMVQTSSGVCSGSLVHPSIVVFAAHCGTTASDIFFGERISKLVDGTAQLDQPARRISLPPGSCKAYPGADFSNGTDFAYCRLPQPVLDVPLVPLLMGCEVGILDDSQEVLIVGFGWSDATRQTGVKRMAWTTSAAQRSNKIKIGDANHASCHGDSGGPAFVRLPRGGALVGQGDDTWRLFGIVSYGPENCRGPSNYSLLHQAVPWIEADSGIDISPCGDAQGSWAPREGCGNYPLVLTDVAGDWASGCSWASTSGVASATCGDPNGAAGQIRLVAPGPKDVLAEGAFSYVDVGLAVGAINGISTTAMGPAATCSLDDQPLAQLAGPSPGIYRFGPVVWTRGTHVLQVRTTDLNGRVSDQRLGLDAAAVDATTPFAAGGGVISGASQPVVLQDTAAGGCAAAPVRTGAAAVVAAGMLAALGRRTGRRCQRRRPRRG